jgi:hypothetical protein
MTPSMIVRRRNAGVFDSRRFSDALQSISFLGLRVAQILQRTLSRPVSTATRRGIERSDPNLQKDTARMCGDAWRRVDG